jgi:hypothetical protein
MAVDIDSGTQIGADGLRHSLAVIDDFQDAAPYSRVTALASLVTQDDFDALIAGAPGALNSMNELAAAIGDDPAFVTTMLNTFSAAAADVENKLGSPGRTGGIGFRPKNLPASWFTALDDINTTTVDVVIDGDSIASQDSGTARAWPHYLQARLGAKALNLAATDGWRAAQTAAQIGSSIVPGFTTNAGTPVDTVPGGWGVTMSNGQKATLVGVTMDGFSLVYATDPSFGSIIVRDGVGGTVLATINCAAAANGGKIWTSGALTLATHTIEIESVGNSKWAGGYVHVGNRTSGARVWPIGKSGWTTTQAATAARAYDFVANLQPDLIIPATGVNDASNASYDSNMRTHIAGFQAAAPSAAIALWAPYRVAARSLHAESVDIANDLGIGLIDAYAMLGGLPIESTRWAGVTVHPNTAGAVLLGEGAARILLGEPFGESLRAAPQPDQITISDGSSSTVINPGNLIYAGDTYFARTGAQIVAVGTGLSILLAAPDGTVQARRFNGKPMPRIGTVASSATPTINTDNVEQCIITAQAAAITSMTTNLSGTPNNGEKLIVRIKDNGTARAITWGAKFEPRGVALPTTTVISKWLRVDFEYDTSTSKWGCISSLQEA